MLTLEPNHEVFLGIRLATKRARKIHRYIERTQVVRAHRGHTARLGHLAQERQEPHGIRAGAVAHTVQVIAQRADRALCEP
ncbi:MAG: hypothetical protein ACREV8_07215, partial [Gammaproteobacteria bacterium]